MKIAIFHNLPSGGAKRTVYEHVKRLAEQHEIDVHSLATANHDFADVRPFAQRHVIASFGPGRLYHSPWGRLNQAVRTMDLLRLRRVMAWLAEPIDWAGYDVALAFPTMARSSCVGQRMHILLPWSIRERVFPCMRPLSNMCIQCGNCVT